MKAHLDLRFMSLKCATDYWGSFRAHKDCKCVECKKSVISVGIHKVPLFNPLIRFFVAPFYLFVKDPNHDLVEVEVKCSKCEKKLTYTFEFSSQLKKKRAGAYQYKVLMVNPHNWPSFHTNCDLLLTDVLKEFEKINIPKDLVQMVAIPPSKQKTQRLMKQADLLVITGSQNNVRSGYESGTPAIGVGMGNVVTIVDETAIIKDAAQKISASKTFDNATSCSSENSIVAVDQVYDDLLKELSKCGGYLLSDMQAKTLESIHWEKGKMAPNLIAQDINVILKSMSLKQLVPKNTKFLNGYKKSRFFAFDAEK